MKKLIAILVVVGALGACDVPFEVLDSQAKCERVQRDLVAYVGHWHMECVDGPLANPNWMGVCYCYRGNDPATFTIRLRTDNLNPADPQRDLAHRMAHEFGHAWYGEYGKDTEYLDEGLAEDFALANLR